jgi:Uma2 family endonuclease
MSLTLDPAIADLETVAELLEHLGDIPAHRVLWKPYPGTATEKDIIAAEGALRKRLCELIDGTLVEKAAGFYASRVSSVITYFIERYMDQQNLGICFGPDAPLRILPRRVRMPDFSFVTWENLPNRELPAEPISNFVPELVGEVISVDNSHCEMENKRRDYFQVGARLVWEIDPDTQSARVYTSPDQSQEIGPDGVLDGGEVLPGFTLPLAQLFARAGRQRGA